MTEDLITFQVCLETVSAAHYVKAKRYFMDSGWVRFHDGTLEIAAFPENRVLSVRVQDPLYYGLPRSSGNVPTGRSYASS